MMLGLPNLLAHGDEPHSAGELLRAWAWEPGVLIALALTGWLYARGLRRLWREAGVGHGVRMWEAWSYAGGWASLVVALVSPIHPWGRVLFSAHMTQHEILMLISAPLLVLGRPILVFLKALPAPTARGLAGLSNTGGWRMTWRAISNPFAAWLGHGLILWLWHVPALFQATLDDELVHTLQHASFLFSAILFWWAVTHGRGRASAYGLAVLYMFTTALHSGLLGLLITFARTVWYPAYSDTTRAWGLTPLEDQQLGGLIMWIPAGLVYVVAGLAFFAGWLRESERRAARLDLKEPPCPASPSA
jgi:putative membrane protein